MDAGGASVGPSAGATVAADVASGVSSAVHLAGANVAAATGSAVRRALLEESPLKEARKTVLQRSLPWHGRLPPL